MNKIKKQNKTIQQHNTGNSNTTPGLKDSIIWTTVCEHLHIASVCAG